MTVTAFNSIRPSWLPWRSVLLGLLASSSGACSASNGGAASTANEGVDASSGGGEASPGSDSSSSDGAAGSSGSSGRSSSGSSDSSSSSGSGSSSGSSSTGAGSSSGSGSGSGSGGSSGSSNSSDASVISGSAGDGGTVCPLPTKFKWTSTGPLAQPKAGWVSLKNFSDVVFNNQHIVYYSGGSTSGKWVGGMMTFPDWAQMATATQYDMPVISAAPTLIYFSPKKIWIDIYQYTQWTFSYVTSTDPTTPSSWSAPKELYNQEHGIDNTVICDSTTCYLFLTNDDGKVYRTSMPIDDFPGVFTNPTTVVLSDSTANLFEAEQVYAIKGTPNQYLMIVEALGSGRYFRSFTATDLGGAWTPLAATQSNPFAGTANVTFTDGDVWTHSISHGDMVRTNPDETQTIDPCNLQFLYQGTGPSSGSYIDTPYRPGLLTLVP